MKVSNLSILFDLKVFIVTAYRDGDKEGHSYVVGARANRNDAFKLKAAEENHRGGKYICEIVATDLTSGIEIVTNEHGEMSYLVEDPKVDYLYTVPQEIQNGHVLQRMEETRIWLRYMNRYVLPYYNHETYLSHSYEEKPNVY